MSYTYSFLSTKTLRSDLARAGESSDVKLDKVKI